MTSGPTDVIAGVDTHAETHHVAVIAATGARLADAQLPTTKQGYRDLLAFVTGLGPITTIGVEGTNSYGAELSRGCSADQEPARHRPRRPSRPLPGPE